MQKLNFKYFFIYFVAILPTGNSSFGATDTLRVMAYNVLGYGSYPLCQGPNGYYNAYLDTIVQYVNPDIISLEKIGSLQTSPTDHNYTATIGFQDSILQFSLNAAYPGRYNYCMNTNVSASGTECLLFYDQTKLAFLSIVCTYPSVPGNEDFDTYKLYYLDPNLSTTHDTTYLYVTMNHDISGSGNETERGAQIAAEMSQIQDHFSHLANMINMGDFNLRSTSEPLYQTLTKPADANYQYYDPPFYPDATLTTPADWDSNPTSFAAYLTTSTRATEPNACASATVGGAKDWYDHIFLSPWIVNNSNYISYIPHSFRVVGNDGHRINISVNDLPANTSVPANVANCLYKMSNKYPVTVDLLVTPNTTGTSLPDPEILPSSVVNQTLPNEHVTIVNPVDDRITMYFSNGMIGQTFSFDCVDMFGRSQIHRSVTVAGPSTYLPCDLVPGIYYVRITNNTGIVCQTILTKN